MVFSLKLFKTKRVTKAFLKSCLVFCKEKLIFIPILKWLKKSALRKQTNSLDFTTSKNNQTKNKNKKDFKECNKNKKNNRKKKSSKSNQKNLNKKNQK